MNRRQLLKTMGAASAAVGFGLHMPLVRAMDYTGRLFVFIQAEGAWDPTSFCDPKANVPGEAVINHWAETASIQQAGNIPYAPFAGNQAFFDKYYDRMLVINGVDAQTNSHTVGVVHNWSGRVSEGFPTMTALLAAHFAPTAAMSYLNFGGYSQTAGVTRYTRIDDPLQVNNIAYPNQEQSDPLRTYLEPADWQLLRGYRDNQLANLIAEPNQMPRSSRNRSYLQSAFGSATDLREFAALIPPENQLQQPEQFLDFWSTLRRQAQMAMLAFKAGVSVSADLYLGGFDTHQNHDRDHEPLLANLTSGIDYLWDYAELQGMADRLVVVVASDFARTPLYNADDGKDHWPIGSVVVMEKNQPWTNRVVGETDGGHNAFMINPATLLRDDVNGTIIYPKHVHKALRSYLGIGAAPVTTPFPFNNTEDFAFFG